MAAPNSHLEIGRYNQYDPRLIDPFAPVYSNSQTMVLPQSLDTNGYAKVSPPPYNSWHEASQPSASDEALLAQTLDFTRYAAPPPAFTARLPHPVAIPQTTAGLGQSFLRAWAPILESYGIGQRDLLNFIDNLNVVSTANPPLQALNVAGSILGMVPSHVAQATAFGIQMVAKVGTSVVSKGRTEMYMKEVNERMFKPRGLKATIASTPAVRAVLTMPQEGSFLVPLTNEMVGVSPVQRVLISVQPYSAPLQLNVPPPAEQTTMLAKISAKQVEMQVKKSQKKTLKDREKYLKKESRDEEKYEKELKRQQRKQERKENKKQRKAERKKRDKDGASSSTDSDSDTDDRYAEGRKYSNSYQGEHAAVKNGEGKERRQRKDKELNNADKLLWILIDNL